MKTLFQPFLIYPSKALLQICFRSLWWSWWLRRLRCSWLSFTIVPCLLATFQWHLRRHSSLRLLRSLVLKLRMFSHTAQSPIYQWCRSYLSGSWHVNSTVTWRHQIFCSLFSPVFDLVIQPKLLFFGYSWTYWWQLTAGMLLLWSCWICRLLLILLATVFCASGCSWPSVWMGRFWHGSPLSSMAAHSMFVVACWSHFPYCSSVEFLRVLYWAPSFSYSILLS